VLGRNVQGRNWRAALVVDDDRLLRTLVTKLLHELGLPTVLEASSATEAIQLLQIHQPDLVLTDWAMETRDAGLAVVRAADQLGSNVLVVSGAEPALPPEHTGVRWIPKTEVSLDRLRAELDAVAS
jgi:CheY-like chemotaxis protein